MAVKKVGFLSFKKHLLYLEVSTSFHVSNEDLIARASCVSREELEEQVQRVQALESRQLLQHGDYRRPTCRCPETLWFVVFC